MDKISDWVRNKHDLEIEEVAEFHKGFEPLAFGCLAFRNKDGSVCARTFYPVSPEELVGILACSRVVDCEDE